MLNPSTHITQLSTTLLDSVGNGDLTVGSRYDRKPLGSFLLGEDRHGISEQTYYRWCAKYGEMEISEARRLRKSETENSRPKELVADPALDIQILKAVNPKQW